jgi:hypothetical protein
MIHFLYFEYSLALLYDQVILYLLIMKEKHQPLSICTLMENSKDIKSTNAKNKAYTPSFFDLLKIFSFFNPRVTLPFGFNLW